MPQRPQQGPIGRSRCNARGLPVWSYDAGERTRVQAIRPGALAVTRWDGSAHDLDVRVLTTDGEIIRELVLDPTPDYRPQPIT